MRYVAPLAMPVGLGEWLGSELEARGVEAASLYARAVLSILLHSEVVDSDFDSVDLEYTVERSKRGTRKALKKRSMSKNHKRRPHSWNGDEDTYKKCAAIECLLTATDDGQWGPVEKLVDELCARLKLIQLEGSNERWKAPDSDSDSFTSVSSPEELTESYCQAFPPLDKGTEPVTETVWNVRKSRVRFVRMPGTRLSPVSYGSSEAYFGDCSRDSSPEPPTKGRLYERGSNPSALDQVLDSAFKSFIQFADWPIGDTIWAPLESDWALMSHTLSTDPAIQLSLALLNHHPERSGFDPVCSTKLPKTSKLLDWLFAEEQVESSILDPEEEENLLTSPKTHFCPIQQDGAEVEVSDGATFEVDASPDRIHFLKSPSGSIYLPDSEEHGDGWKGWSKYMIYKDQELLTPPPLDDLPIVASSPFTLKFKVVQTEKCCQTETTDGASVVTSPFSSQVWKFHADSVTETLPELKPEEEDVKEVDGLLKEVWNVTSALEAPPEVADDLDELWNPLNEDVCEWVPYPEESGSWLPVEYLDDEFFQEIYGSLDSNKTETTSTKNSRRRRRRSQKQVPARRPKRPCSFFVEGECKRPDCKFSHDLGSIPCRFWIESSCFKGEECPFLHGNPEKNHSCSDASESCGSEDGQRSKKSVRTRKKFELDLEADFPSLSSVSSSRPIAITQGFAAADQTGSSLDGEACGAKRRRRRFTCQRPLAGTSSESSPGETLSINIVPVGKRSRKVAKVATARNERRRTKSEHDTSF